jgi:hypothetical protein
MLTRYPDLDEMLNLQFQPIENDNPKMFTREQIAHYNENGFIKPFKLFEGDELARIAAFFRENEAEMTRCKQKCETYWSPHPHLGGAYDLVSHPRTVAYLQDLIGPNVICHISDLINKPPNQDKGGIHHQDSTFNAMDARCPIVWLAVEDADVENGCMWFIHGSHKLGVVECDEEHYIDDPSQHGEDIPCEVPAGHAIFMSDLVMHSSPANRSKDRYRPGFTATYAPAEITPHKQSNRWAVLCSGEDASGEWQAKPRPAGERLFA